MFSQAISMTSVGVLKLNVQLRNLYRKCCPWILYCHLHVTLEHALIGCQTIILWLFIVSIWSLTDRCTNFTLKVQHVMKLQKDGTLKTSSEKMTLICVNMHNYAFHQSGFTSHLTMKYLVGARLSESFSMYRWRSLMTNFKHGHKTMYPRSEYWRVLLFDESPRKISFHSRRDLSATFTGNPSKSIFVDGEYFERKSSHYSLLNFNCLMTNNAMFDTQ